MKYEHYPRGEQALCNRGLSERLCQLGVYLCVFVFVFMCIRICICVIEFFEGMSGGFCQLHMVRRKVDRFLLCPDLCSVFLM